MISFRNAHIIDLEKIVGTYNASIPSRLATADLLPVTVDEKKAWFLSHSPDARPLLVVEWNGVYAGWMSFKSFYGRPAYHGTVELGIYLEPGFHGKGIGKQCVLTAIDMCPSLNIHTLLAFVFAHNEASTHLFISHGFKTWGHLPEVANMDGVMRDLLILGRKV